MNAHVSAARYAHAALTRECSEIARTTAGRNVRLNRGAFAVGGFVGAGHIDRGEAENALFNAAIANSSVAQDGAARARATIRSGLDAGILEPRDPPVRDDRRPAPAPDPEAVARLERARERQRLAREAEDRIKGDRLRQMFAEADPRPYEGLPGRYYAEHRSLPLDLLAEVGGHAIRFAALGPWEGDRAPMLLDAFRDFQTNAVVGLRRTRLDPVTAAKVGRKWLGRGAGAAIKLSRDSEVGTGLCVAEGTETALAAMMIGWRPAWALGSAGAIRTLPLLPGIESLSICAEFDDGGANAAAIEECGNRWSDAGREVLILAPKVGDDINAAVMEATR